MEKKQVDLSSIDTVKGANEGFDVQLYHPGTNEDLGVTIQVLGKDSDEFQKISRAQSKKRMERMSKGGFRNPVVSPEEVEQDNLNLLAAVSRGWNNVIVDGKPLPFSKENALMLYERFPWIREQIDAAIGDRANFIKTW